MNAQSFSRMTLLKAILLFMAAAAFSWCLWGFIHEGGHLIANEAVGSPRTGLSLHPFGMNYNIYVNEDDTYYFQTPEVENAFVRWAILGGSGPVLGLVVCVLIGLLFWRKRSAALLPLLMTGSLALLSEGYPMLEQAFGGGGDWYQVINGVGVPKILVVVFGAIFFAAGCIWMLQLLPLAGISAKYPFRHRLVVLLAGMPLFISGTVFYQLLFGVDLFVPSWNRIVTVRDIVNQHLIELAIAIIIMTAIAALHRPLSSFLERLSQTSVAQIRWRAVLISIGLAVVIIAVQLVFFNDPTARVLR